MAPKITTELTPPPTASSAQRPWIGMTVQLHDWLGAGSVVSPVVDHDILAMRYTGRVNLEQHRAGKVHKMLAVPGNITIHPRGFESSWRWDRPGAIIVARVPQPLLREAATETLRAGTQDIELRNCFGARDDFIEPMMGLFAQELQRPADPAQELISESLSCALAAHLVHRFNTRTAPQISDPAGLNPRALDRVLDYMRENLASSIGLSQLAQLAGVSRFHFARMFRRSTGESPRGYLEQMRIRHAQELLRAGRLSLAQIAVAVGFADQSHFTRKFRRAVGCTPAVYARHHAARSASLL